MQKNFRTYQLAITFYRQVGNIKLSGHLKEQLRRAAASIVLNLAEGSGRTTALDRVKFYNIAFGSLRECQAVLDLAGPQGASAGACADSLAAHIYRLITNTK